MTAAAGTFEPRPGTNGGTTVGSYVYARKMSKSTPSPIDNGTVAGPVFVGASDDPHYPIELRIGLQSLKRIGYRAGSPRWANLSRSQARALAYSLLAIAEEPEK